MRTELDIGSCRFEIREDLDGMFHVIDIKNHKRLAEFRMFNDAMVFAKRAVTNGDSRDGT